MNEFMTMAVPLWAVLAYLLFMCAVQALPRPEQSSAPFYVWVYQFSHLLCMNLSLVFDPTKKLKTETTTDTVTVTSTKTVPTVPADPPAEPKP